MLSFFGIHVRQPQLSETPTPKAVRIFPYLSYVPPTDRVWHKDVFSWVRVQSNRPDMLGGSKNASSPVGMLLQKGCLRRKEINIAYPRKIEPGGRPLEAWRESAAWCECLAYLASTSNSLARMKFHRQRQLGYLHAPTIVSNVFIRNGTFTLMFIGKIYSSMSTRLALFYASKLGNPVMICSHLLSMV